MFSDWSLPKNMAIYATRRKKLINAIKQEYADACGAIVLFGGFENDRTVFRQESSFYYLTGMQEPGCVLYVDFDGVSTLYIPNYTEKRSKWMVSAIEPTSECAQKLGVDNIELLGSPCAGYQLNPFFVKDCYNALIERLKKITISGEKLFTLAPQHAHNYIEQHVVLDRLKGFMPKLSSCVVDIASIVAQLRRCKDEHEIEQLYKAIEVTSVAHEAAAQTIADGVLESEVQASLEAIMTMSGARVAFPSIVASGKNGTILHYIQNNGPIKKGELVVVDIGASHEYYCADLTRTYPVSGKFTKRQRELYNMVLDTQEYIAEIAKPGLWLSNKEKPEESLHHLAKKFLAKKGYDQYFTHGIGHFLGLDVHDVGDYTRPLCEGDVITIEPGLYIPEENIGIRIEDNYWIVKGGAVCLSDDLPKKTDDIEKFMQETPDVPLKDNPEVENALKEFAQIFKKLDGSGEIEH